MSMLCGLLYCTGMRLLECLRLRVKDLEFARREIVVRAGNGNKDRVTILPENLMAPLKNQLARIKTLYERDLAAGFSEVVLPNALDVKKKSVAKTWGWQWVCASNVRSFDPRSGIEGRHHLYPESVQRHVRDAAKRTDISKPCSPQVLRHSFATHFLRPAVTFARSRNCH